MYQDILSFRQLFGGGKRGKQESDTVLSKNKHRKITGILLSILIVVFCNTPYFKSIVYFPEEIKIIEGEAKHLDLFFPFALSVRSDSSNTLKINGREITTKKILLNLSTPLILQSDDTGKINLRFSILGIVPFKKVVVNVLPKITAIPGGHSIGVKLKSRGVIVVGFAPVIGKRGLRSNPAEKAGVRLGDTILEINNIKIMSPEHVNELINNSRGKPLVLKIKRDHKIFKTDVKPEYDVREKSYQIGLWIRDIAAGVGTLSFYMPENNSYGALGHIITDLDTGKPIEVKEGEIIKAQIAAIEKGFRNKPGEKKGVFVHEEKILGNILRNTEYGIYGKLKTPLRNPYYKKAIPVALISEVKEGPAEILTVLKGDTIQKFDVVIEKVYKQKNPRPKGLIIRITDKRLLKETGGIIQGMSGSPIIQNNKLIGAITHVFVNDPTRGYGVFMEWMIKIAQQIEGNDMKMAANF